MTDPAPAEQSQRPAVEAGRCRFQLLITEATGEQRVVECEGTVSASKLEVQ